MSLKSFNSTLTKPLELPEESCFKKDFIKKDKGFFIKEGRHRHEITYYSDDVDFTLSGYGNTQQAARIEAEQRMWCTVFKFHYEENGILGLLDPTKPFVEATLLAGEQTLEQIRKWKQNKRNRGKLSDNEIN